MTSPHDSDSTPPPIKDDNSLRNKEGQNIGSSNPTPEEEPEKAESEDISKEGGQTEALKQIQDAENLPKPPIHDGA